jgi:hypothetical protein
MHYYLPSSFASSNRSLPVNPVGAAAYEVNAPLPIIPLSASIFITAPAAMTVAADAEAIKSGLDARSMRLCDFTVDIEVGATVGTAVLLEELAAVVCDLVVVLVLGFAVLVAAGVFDAGLAVVWLLALLLGDFLEEPPEEEPDEPPLDVGAAVGVTPGT